MTPALQLEYVLFPLIPIAGITAFLVTLFLYSGRKRKTIKTPTAVTIALIGAMWASWFGMMLYLRPNIITQSSDELYSLLLSLLFLFSAGGIEYFIYKGWRKVSTTTG